jgi:hypothetical protein
MKHFLLPLIIAITGFTTTVAFAGAYEKNPKAAITYAGIKEKGIAFDVSWEGHTGTAEIVIKDKNNNVVYKAAFTEASLKKRFYLSSEESDVFTFTIIHEKKRTEKKFVISTSYIEQVQVNEL